MYLYTFGIKIIEFKLIRWLNKKGVIDFFNLCQGIDIDYGAKDRSGCDWKMRFLLILSLVLAVQCEDDRWVSIGEICLIL